MTNWAGLLLFPSFCDLRFPLAVTLLILRSSDCSEKSSASSTLIRCPLLARDYSLRFIFGMSCLSGLHMTEISGLPFFISLYSDCIALEPSADFCSRRNIQSKVCSEPAVYFISGFVT